MIFRSKRMLCSWLVTHLKTPCFPTHPRPQSQHIAPISFHFVIEFSLCCVLFGVAYLYIFVLYIHNGPMPLHRRWWLFSLCTFFLSVVIQTFCINFYSNEARPLKINMSCTGVEKHLWLTDSYIYKKKPGEKCPYISWVVKVAFILLNF